MRWNFGFMIAIHDQYIDSKTDIIDNNARLLGNNVNQLRLKR